MGCDGEGKWARVTFAPIKREAIPLLLGVAGGTGSGKTYSALLLARGIAAGHPFAAIDTENGRMSHYADLFPEVHVDRLAAPFRPDAYTAKMDEAIAYLEQQGVPQANRVVLIDSMSHEWAGDGGCLDWQEDEMGGVEAKRASSWIKPKRAHKKMMTHLTQMPAHAVLCFRAEERVEFVKNAQGKLEVLPKRTLPGGSLDGWVFLSEKNVPYELTASFLLMADAPGVPRPIKLQEQHKPFVPLDRPLTEQVGRDLAGWAQGSAPDVSRGPDLSGASPVGNGGGTGADKLAGEPQADIPGESDSSTRVGSAPVSQPGEEAASPAEILELAAQIIGARPDAAAHIEKHAAEHPPAEHLAWLRKQRERLVAA